MAMLQFESNLGKEKAKSTQSPFKYATQAMTAVWFAQEEEERQNE